MIIFKPAESLIDTCISFVVDLFIQLDPDVFEESVVTYILMNTGEFQRAVYKVSVIRAGTRRENTCLI